MLDALDAFGPATAAWFRGAFAAPTPAQEGAWAATQNGGSALVIAPTGSGKTLAAFLTAIDRLAREPKPDDPLRRTRVLYLSPLKALGVDVERNLRSPLVGIARTAAEQGLPSPDITVGVRSGDTPPVERRRPLKTPPDVLITTPESLFLMLTSAARETLAGVETIIVDEIHAVASTKRGAHLAVSLERLDAMLERPAQRIGLSATVRPPEAVARFLGGPHPVAIVAPESRGRVELQVVVPVDDMSDLGSAPPREGATSASTDETTPQQQSIWPHVEEAIVDRVVEQRSTIVFTNSRRLAERLTSRLNEIWVGRQVEAGDADATPAADRIPAQMMGQSGQTSGAEPVLARAHHGSVSKEQRAQIEDDLKRGHLRCVVATSSLELGIDMGAVDLVIQVESPPSVASGLQRVGRAGHQVGEVSRGVLFPKHRADLVHATVTTERMREGRIERIAVPQNPLDILAQQTVAHTALGPVDVDDWFEIVRRSAPFASLPRSAYEATLDLVSGLYPSDEFAELRPRVVWDRVSGTLTGRPGAQRLAVTSGGTIPDRGMFGVFLAGAERGGRVGELDEEMVYESRVGDVFALGATSWRIEDITHDRVVVTPAFGEPGRVPFWTGDALGRSAELGAAIGAFLREAGRWSDEDAQTRLADAGLDPRAAQNLLAFLAEQRAATGQLPSDRTLVVERFRDELGDWRVVLHSPYGNRVHQPWALAITARIRERHGFDGGAMASDDGIVVRLPDTDAEPPGAELFVFDPDELEQSITERVGDSALFASRFRECAARALLLPRRNPGRRAPLWQQRQRGAQLLEVARRYPAFPIVLETVREVLQDVYDVPALREVAESIASRRIRLLEVETADASPFARSLLFGYVASFLYEGDAPLAERRAAALSLDTTMLAELLGRAELRELLDPDVIATTEAQLQRTHPDRRLKGVEGAVDLLRLLGPMDAAALRERLDPASIAEIDLDAALERLRREQRVMRLQLAGPSGDRAERWAVVEDAARLRDALGVPLPIGLPEAYLAPVPDAVGDLVSRYARTHGPFQPGDAAASLGLGVAVVHDALRRLAGDRRVLEGEFRPGSTGTDWCDAEVLTRLRSRSLAALRREVEPVEPAQLARFLPVWQHADRSLRGVDGVLQVVEQLAGVAVPASAWESLVLPSRVRDYQPAMLDELTSTGEVLWSGDGTIAGSDGWVRLHVAETAHLTIDPASEAPDAAGQAVLDALANGGGWFFRQLQQTLDVPDAELTATLWQLVWGGHVTNDTLASLRIRTGAASRRARQPVRTRAYRGRMRPRGTSQAAAPEVGGRWTLTPTPEADATVRRLANAEQLLERHGIVTRGAVQSEQVPGGFAAAYRVLTQLEEAGQTRRGYFVAGLGAAQFATPATVDRLRAFGVDPDQAPPLVARTLAATDPANPYGAALPWPQRDEGHRPGRKAGALVTIVDGALTLFVERGGRTLLTFDDEPARLAAAAASLASIAPALGRLAVHTVDGDSVLGSVLDPVLREAGFALTPKGLRLG